MKGYIVKATAKATDDNPNFKGKTEVWYCGKHGLSWQEKENRYMAKRYCYQKRGNARKLIEKAKERDERFWTYEYKIVEVNEEQETMAQFLGRKLIGR